MAEQLSLFDDIEEVVTAEVTEEEPIEQEEQKSVEYGDLIRNISFDQKEILCNIIKLHNNGKPFQCDMTYSTGKFYEVKKSDKFIVPTPELKYDIEPQTTDTIKYDAWGRWPFDDNSLESIVLDPPFIIGPRDCASMVNGNDDSNKMAKRFSSYYPVGELLMSYMHHISEAYRVLREDGILVFKSQSTITARKSLWSTEWVWLCASMVGFNVIDQFILLAKHRLHSGKMKNQEHARKFTSNFYVMKKSNKNKIKMFDFMTEELRNEFLIKLSENMVSQGKYVKPFEIPNRRTDEVART